MSWLKTIVVDLLVTAVIVLAVTTEVAWARWAVIIYTPIMVLFKLFAVVGGSLTRQFKSRTTEAPAWVLHLLYAINVIAPALAQWWIIAAGWGAIWLLSGMQQWQSGSRT